MGSYYKRDIPGLGLSVERATVKVPNDGLFYLLKKGRVLESFRSEEAAVMKFRQMVSEIGYQPPEQALDTPLTPTKEALQHHFDRREMFWSQSHKHQRKGGKGRA